METILSIADFEEGRIIIARDEDKIIGYATFCTLIQWSVGQLTRWIIYWN